jgi:hypothetical protein
MDRVLEREAVLPLSLPRITNLARGMRPVLLACLDDLGVAIAP